jgi:hypothetical protein
VSERYGVSVMAIAPGARTRMTEGLIEEAGDGPDPYDPAAVAEVVAWLAGPGGRTLSGQVLFVQGGCLSLLQPWQSGPTVRREAFHTRSELDEVVPTLLRQVVTRAEEQLLQGERP